MHITSSKNLRKERGDQFACIEGNSKLKISGVTVSGDFLAQSKCGKVLGIGKSCTIQVSFKPKSKGNRTGEVTIADDAPGKTQKISLKGVGK